MSPNARILFVCLGNICRSPTAEGVFRALAAAAGAAAKYPCDSAGTSGNHDGELPDPRTYAVAAGHGLKLTHRSRRVRAADFAEFDWLVAMDSANQRELHKLAPDAAAAAKIVLLRSFERGADSLEVPDPWYSGEFELVYAICERGCAGLLTQLRAGAMRAPH